MYELKIPSLGHFKFKHIVFDYNGTLATDGKLSEETRQRLERLSKQLSVHILTLDTYGSVQKSLEDLPVTIAIVGGDNGTQSKADYIESLGRDHCIAVGNGSNDCKMLKMAMLSIAIIGHEGLSSKALKDADLIFISIEDVFESLENPMRLMATLRE